MDGHWGRAVPALRVDDRETFAANSLWTSPALRGREAHEGLKQIGGSGGAFNEFAGPGPHGINDDLRLVQIADRKNGGVGHLLVQQFNGSPSPSRIVSGNIDQRN